MYASSQRPVTNESISLYVSVTFIPLTVRTGITSVDSTKKAHTCTLEENVRASYLSTPLFLATYVRRLCVYVCDHDWKSSLPISRDGEDEGQGDELL